LCISTYALRPDAGSLTTDIAELFIEADGVQRRRHNHPAPAAIHRIGFNLTDAARSKAAPCPSGIDKNTAHQRTLAVQMELPSAARNQPITKYRPSAMSSSSPAAGLRHQTAFSRAL
jgi:hypothetical protein